MPKRAPPVGLNGHLPLRICDLNKIAQYRSSAGALRNSAQRLLNLRG